MDSWPGGSLPARQGPDDRPVASPFPSPDKGVSARLGSAGRAHSGPACMCPSFASLVRPQAGASAEERHAKAAQAVGARLAVMPVDSIPVVNSLEQIYGSGAPGTCVHSPSQCCHIWSHLAWANAADAGFLEEQRERYQALVARFVDLYGSPPEFVVRSPGTRQLSSPGRKMVSVKA